MVSVRGRLLIDAAVISFTAPCLREISVSLVVRLASDCRVVSVAIVFGRSSLALRSNSTRLLRRCHLALCPREFYWRYSLRPRLAMLRHNWCLLVGVHNRDVRTIRSAIRQSAVVLGPASPLFLCLFGQITSKNETFRTLLPLELPGHFTLAARLAIARKRHQQVFVPVVRGAHGRTLRVFQFQGDRFLRIEHLQEVAEIAGVQRDRERIAFVSDG